MKLPANPSRVNAEQVSDCLQVAPARLERCRRLGEILVNDVLPSLGVNSKVIEKIKNGTFEEEDPEKSQDDDV